MFFLQIPFDESGSDNIPVWNAVIFKSKTENSL